MGYNGPFGVSQLLSEGIITVYPAWYILVRLRIFWYVLVHTDTPWYVLVSVGTYTKLFDRYFLLHLIYDVACHVTFCHKLVYILNIKKASRKYVGEIPVHSFLFLVSTIKTKYLHHIEQLCLPQTA